MIEHSSLSSMKVAIWWVAYPEIFSNLLKQNIPLQSIILSLLEEKLSTDTYIVDGVMSKARSRMGCIITGCMYEVFIFYRLFSDMWRRRCFTNVLIKFKNDFIMFKINVYSLYFKIAVDLRRYRLSIWLLNSMWENRLLAFNPSLDRYFIYSGSSQ